MFYYSTGAVESKGGFFFAIFPSRILCQIFFSFFPLFRPFDEVHKQTVKLAIIVCL